MRVSTPVLVFTAVLALAAATPGFGQTAPALVAPRAPEVFVRSTDGVELRGRLLEMQPFTLSLFVDGTRRDVLFDSIDRIQTQGDGVKNGALIGAAFGTVVAGLMLGRAGSQATPYAFGAVIGYTIVGAGLDALTPGRTTIYSRSGSAASSPGGKRAGLALRIGF